MSEQTDLFLYTRDAVAILYGLGFIGGKGLVIPYPGLTAVLTAAGKTASAVLQLTPNNASTTIALTGLGSLTAPRT